METLLLVDGNALIHRAYHALPEFTTKEGNHTNAVYGFASMLFKIVRDYQPKYIIVCFDTPAPTFRDHIYKNYRSQRPEVDHKLTNQFPLVKEFLDSAGIKFIEHDGMEADDLIATFAKMSEKYQTKTLITTGDKDILQLVNDNTFVLSPQFGITKGKLYDHDAVVKKFSVEPRFIPDFKALAGDPSDNYRGVSGIGPKTAAELIAQFGNIENIYRNIDKVENKTVKQKLIADKKNALLSKKLAVLVANLKLPITIKEAEFSDYDPRLRSFFEKYQFKSLYRRFFESTENNKPPPIKNKHSESKNQPGLF